MSKPPLRQRIARALELAPMTETGVARCLSVTQQTANVALRRMERCGMVRRHGWSKGKHGMAQLFEIAA